jgi:hypothetical protein
VKTLTTAVGLLLLLVSPALANKPAPNKVPRKQLGKTKTATKPAARPAARPAAARPAARKVASKKSVMTYGVFYKGKRVGYSVRTEIHNGSTIRVSTKTDFTVSFLYFFKTRVQSTGLNLYNSKGQLQSFRAVSTVRKRRMKIWGKRTKKGLLVHRQQGKAKTKSKTFALKSFDRTSLDYKAVHHLKVTKKNLKRRLLMVAQQKIVPQEVSIAKFTAKSKPGQKLLKVNLFKVVIKTGKKSGFLVLAQDGRMVEANMGRKLRIRLEKIN